MKYKFTPNIFSIIITGIVGGALFNQFDFQNLKFDKPALAIVYIVVFIFSIGSMIKKSKNK